MSLNAAEVVISLKRRKVWVIVAATDLSALLNCRLCRQKLTIKRLQFLCRMQSVMLVVVLMSAYCYPTINCWLLQDSEEFSAGNLIFNTCSIDDFTELIVTFILVLKQSLPMTIITPFTVIQLGKNLRFIRDH